MSEKERKTAKREILHDEKDEENLPKERTLARGQEEAFNKKGIAVRKGVSRGMQKAVVNTAWV